MAWESRESTRMGKLILKRRASRRSAPSGMALLKNEKLPKPYQTRRRTATQKYKNLALVLSPSAPSGQGLLERIFDRTNWPGFITAVNPPLSTNSTALVPALAGFRDNRYTAQSPRLIPDAQFSCSIVYIPVVRLRLPRAQMVRATRPAD